MGILLVYDVSDENSFVNVRNWMRQIDQNAAENVNRILIGNKADVDTENASDRVSRSKKGEQLFSYFHLRNHHFYKVIDVRSLLSIKTESHV